VTSELDGFGIHAEAASEASATLDTNLEALQDGVRVAVGAELPVMYSLQVKERYVEAQSGVQDTRRSRVLDFASFPQASRACFYASFFALREPSIAL